MNKAKPVTLVTGASSGLGADFARVCAARGDELVVAARRRDRLEALSAELGPKVHVIACDLASADGPVALVEEVHRRDLWIETLINNAGFGLAGVFSDQPAERLREMVRVNVEALTVLTSLCLPAMVERRRGAILNVASTAAFQPGPGLAVYFATKAYVLSLTEALHQELKGTGVKVSALCPGPTATEFGKVAGTGGERFDLFTAQSHAVVAAGLKGLARNKAVIIPGLSNKVTAQTSRFLPRGAMRRIVASLKL